MKLDDRMIPETHIKVAEASYEFPTHLEDEQMKFHAVKTAARAVSDFILTEKCAEIIYGKPDERDYRQKVTVRMAVVSLDYFKSMEERAKDNQDIVARGVVDALLAKVQNWGSYYRSDTIDKSMVHRFAKEALEEFDIK